MEHSKNAVELFNKGFNCSQAVFAAFSEKVGLSQEQCLKLSGPFGGGFGRQREVCGAVSGMLMAFGLLYGYDSIDNDSVKAELYEKTRALCDEFKEINGSIICREILKTAESGGNPEKRTEQYYKERPCERCVRTAAEILEKYIENN